ncbi:MAG TPA: hypothetical protein VK499_16835 [Propionibacteriaceae bacterium]|nr:hypothetical protein [Propionibacteriaceae bacterium]
MAEPAQHPPLRAGALVSRDQDRLTADVVIAPVWVAPLSPGH